VSFSTFWHAKGGLQTCVFLGRAMNFFGPSLGGGVIATLAPPPWIRRCVDEGHISRTQPLPYPERGGWVLPLPGFLDILAYVHTV